MKLFSDKKYLTVIHIFALIGLVFTTVFIGMNFGLFNVRGGNAERNAALGIVATAPTNTCIDSSEKSCAWNKTVEWDVLKTAFKKDAAMIERVANETGVSPRMLVATITPEQIRFFTSNRESYKRVFEPLKILVSLSKFSLGISGIKQETADQIEQYANDPTSPFYPGEGAARLIAYPDGADHSSELYNRLTDAKNHYYSYLYTAIYIKEIEAQWLRAGFDVSDNPEVIVTLFNIGFHASVPKADPIAAGAPITLAGHTYAYGELGTLIYNSNELPEFRK